MSQLEYRARKVNTLLGIELEVVKHDQPFVKYEESGEIVHDYTVPFHVQINRTDGLVEIITPRLNFGEVQMFLEGIHFVGHRSRVEMESAYTG